MSNKTWSVAETCDISCFWQLLLLVAVFLRFSSHLIWPRLISSHLISPHLISSHLISSDLVSSRLISSSWTMVFRRPWCFVDIGGWVGWGHVLTFMWTCWWRACYPVAGGRCMYVLTFMWTCWWRACYPVAGGRCMYSWVGSGGACMY